MNNQNESALLEFEPDTAAPLARIDNYSTPPASRAQKIAMGTAVTVPFIGFIVAVVLTWQVGWMGWSYLAMIVGGWAITALGVTVGFHRLLAHRSFETYGWVRAFWMTMGALSVQGSPMVWCAVHRRHHERSDKQGDPHSPHGHNGGVWSIMKGFLHAHIGWLFTGFWSTPELRRYVPDLCNDRMLKLVDRFYYAWVAASLLAPALLGALIEQSWKGFFLGLLWGGLVRVFLTHHATWSINSVCHTFGTREYRSGDHSRNNFVCAMLTFGEGWHNNHHAFPTSARHGLRWWQIDGSWMVIRLMERLGLAWNIRLPAESALEAKRIK
ncbi:MAG: acyl-CoA desaturase [Planctomycetales bacterium]|nr:acyl-CoA desaturase [Planctomycetales bacterium]